MDIEGESELSAFAVNNLKKKKSKNKKSVRNIVKELKPIKLVEEKVKVQRKEKKIFRKKTKKEKNKLTVQSGNKYGRKSTKRRAKNETSISEYSTISSSTGNENVPFNDIEGDDESSIIKLDANKITNSVKEEERTCIMPSFDNITNGMDIFKWIIAPLEIHQFFNNIWEKTPFLIKRTNENYYSNLISIQMIDTMLRENHIEFTKNIDITSYSNSVRETHNPEGRALPVMVWDYYSNGCSIRLLNPQTFLKTIHNMNATLQEYFHCMVGANVYLTPPNSQGFAPHYDDIEAFVLQVEGRKKWKLYNPRKMDEVLPRFSSGNFSQEEIGEPVLETVLEAGDILYFPRGTIHQASTEPGYHSLHITLSVYQKQTYADLLEHLLPVMLEKVIQDKVELRRGLPLNIWHNLGVVNSSKRTKDREEIFSYFKNVLQEMLSDIPLDNAVDQMAKRFQHDALPPSIMKSEKPCTVFGSKIIPNESGEIDYDCFLLDKTKIRLLRANIMRLVFEGGKYRIYYYSDNSREYHEYEANFIEIEDEEAGAVEYLINSYPDYIKVKHLPIAQKEERVTLAQGLWERGLLILEKANK